jgi:predicted nucleotidyltransferase
MKNKLILLYLLIILLHSCNRNNDFDLVVAYTKGWLDANKSCVSKIKETGTLSEHDIQMLYEKDRNEYILLLKNNYGK